MVREDIVSALTDLGLTTYEAKVFVALTLLGEASVGEIYPQADVPRSAVYGILKKLQQKGMVEIAHGKPTKFRALRPDVALEKLERTFSNAKERAISNLTAMHRSISSKSTEEAVWIIRGRKNIDDKIIALVESAEREILFGARTSYFSWLSEYLRSAKKRGVEMRFLVPEEELKKNRELEALGDVVSLPLEKTLPNELSMSILLVDKRVALFNAVYKGESTLSEETAFWSDSIAFVSLIDFSLRQLVESIKERSSQKLKQI